MRDVDEVRVAGAVDAIYDAAIDPASWPAALTQLGILFRSHFVDIFARTNDWSQVRGRAIGLDVADYEDQFLGVWCDRNVWSKTKPVRTAGEVLPTWKMVKKPDLLRSAIYNEYLHSRGLDEGLRLALWAGNGWIMDVSLLRPDDTGPFGMGEIALGRHLLPHLQRAASVTRKLQASLAFASFDAGGRPALLLDGTGKITQMNAAADTMLARFGPLQAQHGQLTARSDLASKRLTAAIAAASALALPESTDLEMPAEPGTGSVQLVVLPVRENAGWTLPGPRGVLVVVTDQGGLPRGPEMLGQRFGLTRAEVEFAASLAGGAALADIARTSGRSIHTVRTHLARVMAKTRTQRQGQLVRLLIDAGMGG